MFNERDFVNFWISRKGYAQMSVCELNIEKADRNNYGTNPVPIVFYNSVDKKWNPSIISKTPMGKIIFPGISISQGLETGVLYRDLKLQHHSNYCVTVGQDYRTSNYWSQVLNQQKIAAIKEYRARTGLGLRESKKVADIDWILVWGQPLVQPPVWKPPASNTRGQYPDPNAVANQFDYQRKIDDAIKSSHHYLDLASKLERKVVQLEDELAETLNKLVDEIDRNKNQPVATNTFKVNVWEIIECQPSDDYDIIEGSIKAAIRLYHPDKVNRCGIVLQELANEITSQLLLFRKQLRR